MVCSSTSGLSNPNTRFWDIEIEGITTRYSTNPTKYITHKSATLLSMYVHYRNGFLPYAGGILDQPAVYEQAMRIIATEIGRLQAQEEEKD